MPCCSPTLTTSPNWLLLLPVQVYVNGDMIYSKGGFNSVNPQPTPQEVKDVVLELFPEAPLTSAEVAAFSKLHEEQIARGQSKH